MKKITAIFVAAAVFAPISFADVPPEPPTESIAPDYGQVCEDHSITVYFANTHTDISFPALRALEAKIDQIDQCAITQIQTSAISTDAASGDEMIALSEARTDSVLESLAAAGVWAPDIQTDIVVSRDTHRPDTMTEPLARRVEVTLLTAPAITS